MITWKNGSYSESIEKNFGWLNIGIDESGQVRFRYYFDNASNQSYVEDVLTGKKVEIVGYAPAQRWSASIIESEIRIDPEVKKIVNSKLQEKILSSDWDVNIKDFFLKSLRNNLNVSSNDTILKLKEVCDLK